MARMSIAMGEPLHNDPDDPDAFALVPRALLISASRTSARSPSFKVSSSSALGREHVFAVQAAGAKAVADSSIYEATVSISR